MNAKTVPDVGLDVFSVHLNVTYTSLQTLQKHFLTSPLVKFNNKYKFTLPAELSSLEQLGSALESIVS